MLVPCPTAITSGVDLQRSFSSFHSFSESGFRVQRVSQVPLKKTKGNRNTMRITATCKHLHAEEIASYVSRLDFLAIPRESKLLPFLAVEFEQLLVFDLDQHALLGVNSTILNIRDLFDFSPWRWLRKREGKQNITSLLRSIWKRMPHLAQADSMMQLQILLSGSYFAVIPPERDHYY